MRYLLDVNALIAFGFRKHSFHDRVGRWMKSGKSDDYLTCSITELGFVRVLGNVRTYGMDVARARELLLDLKQHKSSVLEFIPDANNVSHLPRWVKNFPQVTDGHLAQLAESHGAALATLDRGIPGSFLIP